ncbi:MAG TPA: transglutaminaseTgpA domain-containing protein [Polyangia bacterium]|nr:transglutaminaseTgpA domain-containing protein [Polyangia bacterium]
MKFQATHKLVTYLLALAAFATLASAGAVTRAMAIVFLALVAVSWRVDAGDARAALLDRRLPWTRVLLAAVLVQRTWVVARQLPEPDLVPVVDFVLVALAVKLFYRRSNRDDVHVFVLAFLLVLAAAALGGNLLFAFGFVAYVVLATWALVLFHLRREMEENYLVKHSAQAPSQKVGVSRILNSRRVVGASFFVAMGGVAAAVAAGALATFAFVPRVGAGFVFGAPRAGANLIGFSDDVTLGQYGTLSSDNAAVALRAAVPRIAALPSEAARERATSALYWRGTVYDTYERGHWTRSRSPALRTELALDPSETLASGGPPSGSPPSSDSPSGERRVVVGGGGRVAARDAERQVIDVVGLAAPVAFALDRPVAFGLEPRAGAGAALQLAPRWSDEVALRLAPADAPAIGDGGDGADDGRTDLRTPPGVRYVAYSTDAPDPRAPPSAEARDAYLGPYLASSASLSPRVVALARRLTAGASTDAARIATVTTWLRATHEYTLRLPHPAPELDPVESFLFETPAGHCEYFASAAALLLRAAGVPTRYVNGYLGGEWNDIGHYVAVRDNRAHSWVEAFTPDAGWVRVDATPPLPGVAHAPRLRQLLDALDFRWSRWIVGYDLGRQLELLRRLGRNFHVGLHAPSAPRGRVPGWLVVVLVVALTGVAASRVSRARAPARLFARRARGARGAPVERLYARACARLAAAGLPRARAETPREYATRVTAAGRDGDATLAELTELYAAARFGGRAVDPAALRRLGRQLPGLGHAAREPAAPAHLR